MMQTGKYVFLDIGKGETKIAEAIIKSHSVTILKTAEMRDMSLFVSDTGIIKHIDGFCASLKKTLEDAEIKTTNVIICSSILKIDTRDISEEFKSIKICTANFDKTYGRAVDYAMIHDWYPLGETVTSKEIKQKIYLASGPIDLLKSFMSTLKSVVGLTVVGIEPTFTALSNIQFLYPSTYDLPSMTIIDLGRDETHVQIYKNRAIVHDTDLQMSIHTIAQSLAAKFDLPLPKMKNLIYNIGMIDNEKSRAQLATAAISPDEYFAAFDTCCTEIADSLQKLFVSLISKKLESVLVVFAGGLIDIPGLAEHLQKIYTFTPCNVLGFDTAYNTKALRILNKTNHSISSKFAGCIGLMLKNQNSQHSINLVPQELMVVDSGKVLSNTLTGVCIVIGIVGAIIIGMNIPGTIDFINLFNSRAEAEDILNKYAAAEAENNKLTDYVDNLKNINSTLTPFINFLQTCESETLKIATVDTANILDVTVTQNNSETTESAVVNPLEHIIIRGYAKTSNDITDFYSKLSNNDSIISVNMNGIREINMNTGSGAPDYISIFEMEVQVNG